MLKTNFLLEKSCFAVSLHSSQYLNAFYIFLNFHKANNAQTRNSSHGEFIKTRVERPENFLFPVQITSTSTSTMNKLQ